MAGNLKPNQRLEKAVNRHSFHLKNLWVGVFSGLCVSFLVGFVLAKPVLYVPILKEYEHFYNGVRSGLTVTTSIFVAGLIDGWIEKHRQTIGDKLVKIANYICCALVIICFAFIVWLVNK